MKKLFGGLLALTMMLSCATMASASYQSVYDLYAAWEQDGYPDYVAGVYSTDGSAEHLTVQLVGDTDGALEAQLRGQLLDDSALTVEPGTFSHNELLQINQEIVETYMIQQPGSVVSCGVGWSADGGFGLSGKESRVVVSVLADDVEAFTQLMKDAYGDAVIVEEGTAAHGDVLTADSSGSSPSSKDGSAEPSPAPLDAEPDETSAPNDGSAGISAASWSGGTAVSILVLCVLVGGSVIYAIVSRKKTDFK